MHQFSIFDFVEVELTEFGLEVWRKYTINARLPITNNTIKICFWELANVFGEHLYMGANKLPFKNNSLRIED